MALFVVRHQHAAERCPAQDPYSGAMLLNHLSRPNVRRHGVQIQGEAVVHGEHTLYMIVEAADESGVREFMQPFEMAGSLDIYPASTCARVVASGGCGAALPVNDSVPALDPEGACQQAIDAGLVVHRAHPLNCETSIPALIGGVVMPNARFYVRNHFQIPTLDPAAFRLSVGGLVDRPMSLSVADLRQMPSRTLVVTLECAGQRQNWIQSSRRRRKMGPWGREYRRSGRASPSSKCSTARAYEPTRAKLSFRGADGGTVDGHTEPIRFERSLRLDQTREAEVLLVYAMNGEPLPVQHGYPVRVIVPGWYAVASVKWLTDIEVIDRPFVGHYQTDKYQFEREQEGRSRPRTSHAAARASL